MLDDMLTVVDMDRKLQGTETQVGGFDLVWCGGPIRPVSSVALVVRVRFQIIGNARIENVGKSQSCMVSKLPIIWKQTVQLQGWARTIATDAVTHLGDFQHPLYDVIPIRVCAATNTQSRNSG